MPRASSRSSSSARVSSSWAAPTISAAFSGALAIWFWAIRSCSESATSRCWAPSCRLRSRRRRSWMPASTIRARERRSAASRRSERIARPAAAATEFRISGSARRLRSWTIAPTRWPSSSTGVQAAFARQLGGAAVLAHPALVDPVQELERRVAERVGQAAAQAVGAGRLAELHEQRATASARATRPRSSPTRNVNGTEAKTSWPSSSGRRRHAGRRPTVCAPIMPATSTISTIPDHSSGASVRRCAGLAARQRAVRTQIR